jgi:hypothetical protein
LENAASLGLGFYSTSQGQMTPIVFNLWHQRLIDQPIVSFWLDPYELSFSDHYCENKAFSFRNPEHPRGGEIFFGGVDSQLFEGEIIYANVTKQQKQRWQIRLNE